MKTIPNQTLANSSLGQEGYYNHRPLNPVLSWVKEFVYGQPCPPPLWVTAQCLWDAAVPAWCGNIVCFHITFSLANAMPALASVILALISLYEPPSAMMIAPNTDTIITYLSKNNWIAYCTAESIPSRHDHLFNRSPFVTIVGHSCLSVSWFHQCIDLQLLPPHHSIIHLT